MEAEKNMRAWTGQNVFQWEHKRRWDLPQAGTEMCRADGALMLPGFSSLSVFFRRDSQSVAGAFNLVLWTAPIFFRPLDEDTFAANPAQFLYKLATGPANPISTAGTGTGAHVFGGLITDGQPMGSLLFWQIENATGQAASIVADIYVVPNHRGTMTLDRVSRTVDVTDPAGGQPGAIGRFGRDR